jgi:hypothetical protein
MAYKPLTLLCRTRRQQRRRRDEVAAVLAHSYGGNMEEAQLALARRDLTVFRATAKRLGIAVFQKMDAVTTLALLTEANLGVNQARVVKRFLLQQTGSPILQSEALLKKEMEAQVLAPGELEFGEIEQISKDGTSTTAACGRITSLERVVERDLDSTPYYDHGLGPWAPPGVVPVVMMDDSGGATEKVAASIRSVANPCSTKTLSVVAITEGNDKLANKRALAGDLFKQHAGLPLKSAYCVSRTDPSTEDNYAASARTRHKVLRLSAEYALCLKKSSVTLKLLEKRQHERGSDREHPGLLVLLAREGDGESPGFATLHFEQHFPSAPSVWEGDDDAELFDEDDDDVILAQQRAHRRVLREKLPVAKPLEEVWPVVWGHIFSYVGDGFLGACASFKLLKVAATKADPPVQEPATLDRRVHLLKLTTDASMGLDRALEVRVLEATKARDLMRTCGVAFTATEEALQKADGACSSLEAAAKRNATVLARAARAALNEAQAKLDAAKIAQSAARELLEGTRGAIKRAKFVVSLLMMHHDDDNARCLWWWWWWWW